METGKNYEIHQENDLTFIQRPDGTTEVYKIYDEQFEELDYGRYARYSCEVYAENGTLEKTKWGYVFYGVEYDEWSVPEWDDATNTSDSDVGAVKKGDKWFFVRAEKGERVDDREYDEVSGPWKDGDHFSYAKKEWGPGRGLINGGGRVVFMPLYDTMPIPLENKTFLVCKNGQPGIINRRGEVIVPFGEYQHVEENFERLLCYTYNFTVVKSNGKYGAIDHEGKVAIPIIYDEHFPSPCHETKTTIGRIGDKYQILSADGTELSGLIYDHCEKLGFGFFAVEKDGEKYVINRHGQKFEHLKDIEYLWNEWDREDILYGSGKTGFGIISRSGEVLVPNIYWCLRPLRSGRENLFIAVLDGMYGVINIANEVVVPFDYDDIERMVYGSDYVAVLQNGKWSEESFSRLRVK